MASLHIKVNNTWKDIHSAEGTPAIDVIRGELGLMATKEGCREGDCGSCAVLIGEYSSGQLRYLAVPSCLLALGELKGKHLITLEGLIEGTHDGLTPVMRAFLNENASQCGFCTPGFIIALTSWLAEPKPLDLAGALQAIDGNLCRCTGYAAIRRAARRLIEQFKDLPIDPEARLNALVDAHVLPLSVSEFADEISRLLPQNSIEEKNPQIAQKGKITSNGIVILGGGTDYYVKNPEPGDDFSPFLIRMRPEFKEIAYLDEKEQKWLEIGAAVTVRDFFASELVRQEVPGIEQFETMFASTLIRNLATIGGNIVNASPVADITAMLLALDADLVILSQVQEGFDSSMKARTCRLEKFFLGYKTIDLKTTEVIRAIRIPCCDDPTARRFSFEKASKRKNLDIAAVNTAISFRIEEQKFKDVHISLGGVAPIPVISKAAMELLEGSFCPISDGKMMAELAKKTASSAETSVKPISDVRGSEEYRRRMVYRLMLAHFVRLFEDSGIAEELFP